MGNYKVKVNGNIEELISLFIALGCKYFNHTVSEKNYMIVEDGKGFFCKLKSNFKKSACQEVTVDQLRDMVVLKRNDFKDGTHKAWKGGYVTGTCLVNSLGVFVHKSMGLGWVEFKESDYDELNPITKEPIMKEFLAKDESGSYFLFNSEYPKASEWIEVPEGADTLAGGSSTRYFWKHGFGEKGNMIIGVGESLTRYSGWTGCKDSADVWLDCVNDDSFKIIWQRETQSEALPFIDDEPKYDPEDIGIAKDCALDKLAKEYKLRDRHDGETDEDYRYALEHYIDLENYIAKETLSDQVASAEVARQEFIGDQQKMNESIENFNSLDRGIDFDNFTLIDQPTAFDTQISGDHYKLLPIQPMKFCLANGLDYAQGNVIKYVIRHASKNGKDDLLKAIHNIELMIEHYYG